ncbi:hypothetical protein ES707_08519 [subsurface metagenome]
MALLGFFRSPDMFAPAMIPVAAGKNIANTPQKSAFSKFPRRISSLFGSDFVSVTERIDSPIMTMMIYCILMANLALVYEMASRLIHAIVEMTIGE